VLFASPTMTDITNDVISKLGQAPRDLDTTPTQSRSTTGTRSTSSPAARSTPASGGQRSIRATPRATATPRSN
jgi:hypothetical protein